MSCNCKKNKKKNISNIKSDIDSLKQQASRLEELLNKLTLVTNNSKTQPSEPLIFND